jgi:hypothetical protein
MTDTKIIQLKELQINSRFLEDSLAAILHTILFVRAPPNVAPKDFTCTSLSPLILATCGPKEVDNSVV